MDDKSLLEVSIRRNMSGKLEIQAQADSCIEEFMKNWSGDSSASVDNWGRAWRGTSRISCYDIPMPDKMVRLANSHGYTLWTAGRSLAGTNRRGDDGRILTNLSFLRIVGLTDGLTFTSDDMVSYEGVDSLSMQIGAAVRSFFNDFLREAAANLTVVREV